MLYVGTDEGTIDTFDLSDPTTPVSKASLDVGAAVQSVATRGFLLVAGTSGGLAILALDQPLAPATLTGSPRAIVAPGVNAINLSVSNGHVYVAAGAAGVLDVDIRTAANPAAPVNLSAALAPGHPINAVDVIVSKMPGQTWLLVLDANGDLWGLKLDNRQSLREKCFPDPVMSGCVLDPEFNDPTILGRDPSVLADGTFDPTDPSAGTNVGGVIQPFFHQTHTLLSAGKRLARPSLWEQIGTLTGRRVRDSFMPGSGVLSLPVMQAMRSIQLCESTATSTTPGNLGQLGYADATFLGGGACTPFATSMMRATGGGKLAPVCRRGDPPIWK